MRTDGTHVAARPPWSTRRPHRLDCLIGASVFGAAQTRLTAAPLFARPHFYSEARPDKRAKPAKGHIFSHDPSEEIEALLITGEFRTKFAGDFYQTPPDLAREMAEWAVRPGDSVLEPSAGYGRLATEALKIAGNQVICVEMDMDRALKLPPGCDVRVVDFLTLSPFPVDSVVMNPPFSKSAEARHILHAMKFLRRGGRLTAVASSGVTFRETAIYKELRAAVSQGGHIEELPSCTFSKEGTDVATVLITWTKP